jgi:hypothetical protein
MSPAKSFSMTVMGNASRRWQQEPPFGLHEFVIGRAKDL